MVDPPAAPNSPSAPATPGRRLSLRQRHIAWVRTSGMSGLLVVLVGGVFVLPGIAAFGAAWRLASDIVVTLILVSGVAAVAEHRKLAVLLVVLSAVAIVARWSEWVLPIAALPAFRDAATLIALLTLAGAVGINVFASDRALGDRIFGAIVLYLLLGVMWAVAYAMVDSLLPQAFAGRSDTDSGIADWIYFSFVTLTTVGYGDITPVARLARSIAMLEALVGQLYPAIIIARLVSLQGTSR
jgi:hypothetical protein